MTHVELLSYYEEHKPEAEAEAEAASLIKSGELEQHRRYTFIGNWFEQKLSVEKFWQLKRDCEEQKKRDELLITKRFNDVIQPRLPYSRWFLKPVLCVAGETFELEETGLVEADFGVNEFDNTYHPEFFGALVQSYFCLVGNASGFDECEAGNFIEETAMDWLKTVQEVYHEDFCSYEDDEKFIENYSEEALVVMKALQASEFLFGDCGFEWRHDVKNGELVITVFIGDCSQDCGDNDKEVDKSPFKDLQELSWCECETLDGNAGYDVEVEHLSGDVLAYTLGKHLFEELLKPYENSSNRQLEQLTYYHNQTEALYSFITNHLSPNSEEVQDLVWGELEGTAVIELWGKSLEEVKAELN